MFFFFFLDLWRSGIDFLFDFFFGRGRRFVLGRIQYLFIFGIYVCMYVVRMCREDICML